MSARNGKSRTGAAQQAGKRQRDDLCPCGSGRPLDECCGPYLEGKAWPDDADTMVRSRFSAYCLGKFDYLVETTHPAYREDLTAQMLEEQTRDVHWLRLDMGPCEKDQPEGENGEQDKQTFPFHETNPTNILMSA